ncbi:MAG TPA: IS1380 family transposase [Thermoleophilaceae bacterium]|nr:IS1380 family transposase [Thermoleophilaceae bacterium]
MQTDCTSDQLEFQGLGRRRVVVRFDAERTSSDGGVVVLREVAERTGWLLGFGACFRDGRAAWRTEHTALELVSQRVLGIALGYEDLNDHETLRDDPLFALAAGKRDVLGAERSRERDRGHALAGKSTLNRLEHGCGEATRYHRIDHDDAAIERHFVGCFLDAHAEPPGKIVLDLDATDDPLHGHQEGRFFHGYYGNYCYLPLYIFCDDHLLVAKLRPSNQDAAAGAVEELARVVAQIRTRWPAVEIWIRADSGFAREAVMAWCEANGVEYVLGLARNARLQRAIGGPLHEAKERCEASGEAVRSFVELDYRTKKTWSCTRRVVAKAEVLPGKANPRFVVTSLAADRCAAQELYETIYCARGDMENRIKEQQLALFADRTSTATMRANQLRLWFSSMAYVLIAHLRRSGLADTALARAQAGTIRLRLFKIAAIVRVSARRIAISFSSAYPLQPLFAAVLAQLRRALPLPN